jgi:hypothetical protein
VEGHKQRGMSQTRARLLQRPTEFDPQAQPKHLRGADLSAASPQLQLTSPHETGGVDDFKTLKQACSSEYQGAQGAFKDSMIH